LVQQGLGVVPTTTTSTEATDAPF